MENNNFIPIFPGSDASKKVPPEELKKKILHEVPNRWAKESYIKGWDFEIKTFRKSVSCSSKWKLLNRSTKYKHLLKQY